MATDSVAKIGKYGTICWLALLGTRYLLTYHLGIFWWFNILKQLLKLARSFSDINLLRFCSLGWYLFLRNCTNYI